MNEVLLLRELQQRGAIVEIEDGKLYVEPASALNDELRAAIRRLKPKLLALLQSATTSALSTPNDVAPIFNELPGIDFCERRRVWIWRGFVVPTRGTAPAYRAAFRSTPKDKS